MRSYVHSADSIIMAGIDFEVTARHVFCLFRRISDLLFFWGPPKVGRGSGNIQSVPTKSTIIHAIPDGQLLNTN